MGNYYPMYQFLQNFMRALDGSPVGDVLRVNPLLFPYVEQVFKNFRDFKKPEFEITEVVRNGKTVAVEERIVHMKPFCNLLHLKVEGDTERPRVLLVAPESGHYATLLRETVQSFLRDFDVYITDWIAAQQVPVEQGGFGLDQFVGYTREFIEFLGAKEPLHVVAVCQPGPAVLAALSLQAEFGGVLPKSTVFIGGPIDARINPTKVNQFATDYSYEWFKANTIHTVPASFPGKGREVYPGFLQYAAFVALDPERHLAAERKYRENRDRAMLEFDPIKRQEFLALAEKHKRFYDNYCSVMDVPAEYYLNTIKTVFQEFSLPKGAWMVNDVLVQPSYITKGRFIVLEGELDNIVGVGQTKAVFDLAVNLSPENKVYFLEPGVGHYGIFSGWTFRDKIYPKVRDAMLKK
jgi:poly(3-hydroxybutyrate) depolymerase